MNPTEFRKKWSHKPTPIPPGASGLWYSEECVDQLMEAYVHALAAQPASAPQREAGAWIENAAKQEDGAMVNIGSPSVEPGKAPEKGGAAYEASSPWKGLQNVSWLRRETDEEQGAHSLLEVQGKRETSASQEVGSAALEYKLLSEVACSYSSSDPQVHLDVQRKVNEWFGKAKPEAGATSQEVGAETALPKVSELQQAIEAANIKGGYSRFEIASAIHDFLQRSKSKQKF